MPEKKKISEKSDKRRRAKIKIGVDSDGKPVYKWASGRTKAELAANKEEIRTIHITGNTDARRDILFSVYAQEWYNLYKKPKLGIGSRKNYESVFNKHLFPTFALRQMRAITPNNLQEFLNARAYLGDSQINKLYMTIKLVFEKATAQFVIDRDPSLTLEKPIGKKGKSHRELTDVETAAVLNVARTHPEGLLLSLMYCTGARRGEILGLQWGDIDFTNNTIIFSRDVDFKDKSNEGDLKTDESYRTIPLAPDLRAILWPIRGIGAALVLPAPEAARYLSESTYDRRWERLMMAVYEADKTIEHQDRPSARSRLNKKIAEGRAKKKDLEQPLPQQSILTAHYFRHNFATILYDAGVDVLTAQRWLGHRDPKTTMDIYTHLSERKEKRNVAKLSEQLASAFKVAEKLPDSNK